MCIHIHVDRRAAVIVVVMLSRSSNEREWDSHEVSKRLECYEERHPKDCTASHLTRASRSQGPMTLNTQTLSRGRQSSTHLEPCGMRGSLTQCAAELILRHAWQPSTLYYWGLLAGSVLRLVQQFP